MPLGLVQQRPRLYLVCRYKGFENERNLALHRILSAEMSSLTFERPKKFNLRQYDDDGRFGFGEGEKIHLTFHIDRDAGKYLLETPLSGDQQVRKCEDGRLIITATVVDSAMLERWLRGFGSLIDVIDKTRVNAEFNSA